MRRAAVLLLVALLAGAGCKGSESAETKPGRGGRRGRGRGQLVYPVDVVPVESRKLDYVVTAPGTIEAFEQVQVTSRVAGVVDRVAFTEGQEVKKGDVLVVIDSERFRLAVNSAKAAVAKADAGVKSVQSMVARREAVSDKNPGLIPGEELETYRTRSLTARADKDVAAQALKTAQLNLRDAHVRAPIAGVIQTRTVKTGQYVQPGYLMATLLRREPMLLRFRVEPLEAPRLKPGMMAIFTLRETLRKFRAKITLVSAAADPTTHMVNVTGEVVADGHKYWLRPGSFCDVTLDVRAKRNAPLIPRLAVRATDHGYVSYVVEKDVARERVLTLGMSTKDGWVEVRSGLKAGEQLVIRGAEPLTDGAKVKPRRVPQPGSPATDADGGVLAQPQAHGPAPAAMTPAGGSAAEDGAKGEARPRERRSGRRGQAR